MARINYGRIFNPDQEALNEDFEWSLDAWKTNPAPIAVIDIRSPDGSNATTFRGAIVEADGLTWWERRIRELEENGKS